MVQPETLYCTEKLISISLSPDTNSSWMYNQAQGRNHPCSYIAMYHYKHADTFLLLDNHVYLSYCPSQYPAVLSPPTRSDILHPLLIHLSSDPLYPPLSYLPSVMGRRSPYSSQTSPFRYSLSSSPTTTCYWFPFGN